MDCFVAPLLAMMAESAVLLKQARSPAHGSISTSGFNMPGSSFHRFGSIGYQLMTAINALLTILRHPFAPGLLDTVCVSQKAVYRFVPVTAFLAFRLVE
jgi:hypothetical protein